MNLDDLGHRIIAVLDELALQPLAQLVHAVGGENRLTLSVVVATAAGLGYAYGRKKTYRVDGHQRLSAWRFPVFQNRGEAQVSRILLSHFASPDYHLLNHVTIRMDDGTTQVDHILVSRFGVFVIETKGHKGWIFANPASPNWTQVLFRKKFQFQNPIFQNSRHVRAVQGLLDFLPSDAIQSVVVFTGSAEIKTGPPEGVVLIHDLVDYVKNFTDVVMSRNRLQFCVGRLETSRLAISRETDVEHVQNVARRRGW